MSTAMMEYTGERVLTLSEKLGAKYSLTPAKFAETLKATIFNNKGTSEEMMAFCIVCDEYDLNPFTKEIYGFPNKTGGVTPVVSIDGWLKLINRQKQMDGIEYDDQFDDKGKLVAITCRIYRKDRSRPIQTTEYMAECARNTEPWKQWPRRMLRHKVTIQAARIAFGFSGIYDDDEAERITIDSLPSPPKKIPSMPLADMLAKPELKPTRPKEQPPIVEKSEFIQPDAQQESNIEVHPPVESQEPGDSLEEARQVLDHCPTLARLNAAYDRAIEAMPKFSDHLGELYQVNKKRLSKRGEQSNLLGE
jgi:phage recombination protein Bet